MANNGKRKTGPLTRAFFKGLSIVLPAIITIALFAWVWDILRVNVVELLIRGIDSVALFEPRRLNKDERAYLRKFNQEKWLVYMDWAVQDWGKPTPAEEPLNERREYDELARARAAREAANGLGGVQVNVLIRDLPGSSWGYSPPMKQRGLLQLILDANRWPREYDPDTGRVQRFHWFEYLLATVVGLTLVVLLGFGTRNFLGKRLVALLEWFVTRTPVVKSVYPHAKQLVEFFFREQKPLEFDTVCAIEYPRERCWSIAFVTGAGLQTLQDHTGKRMVTVYVPSSPAPMTGYTMFLAAEEVVRLDITVEEAMKIVVSGGVLTPMQETVRPASGAQLALTHKINEQIRARQTTMLNKSDLAKPPADAGQEAKPAEAPKS
jgi:uncharacterized membrane protein